MFNLRKIINGRMNVPEPEFLPVKANETYIEGEALVLAAGKLTKATGTTKPVFIAAMNYVAPSTDAINLPCYRVEKNMVFEVPVTFSATPKDLVIGSKVTVSADGMGVTDIATDGVVTIMDKLQADKTTGEKVLVIIE